MIQGECVVDSDVEEKVDEDAVYLELLESDEWSWRLKAGVIVSLSWRCCSSLLGPEGNQAINGFFDDGSYEEATWCYPKPVIYLQPEARWANVWRVDGVK